MIEEVIVKGEFPLITSGPYTQDVYDIVHLMLLKDPSKRPTVEQLLKRNYVVKVAGELNMMDYFTTYGLLSE